MNLWILNNFNVISFFLELILYLFLMHNYIHQYIFFLLILVIIILMLYLDLMNYYDWILIHNNLIILDFMKICIFLMNVHIICLNLFDFFVILLIHYFILYDQNLSNQLFLIVMDINIFHIVLNMNLNEILVVIIYL